jgi:RNA polymerase sigma-70 factor (ECF subfamily)
VTPDGPVEQVFREQYARAVAVLVRVFGDVDVAEEAVADAFTTAVQRWPEDGVPPSPAGWIITTARNRAIDRLRREATRADRHAQAALLHARALPAPLKAPFRGSARACEKEDPLLPTPRRLGAGP